jgi:hypothetical protein
MSTIARRPAPPDYPPRDGYAWTVVVDEDWRLATADEAAIRKCRGSTWHPCPNPPAAALSRGFAGRRRWWFYCAEHMYGRWIEDGQVVMWSARPVPA